MVRCNAKDVSIQGRVTQGVKIINIDRKQENVISVTRVDSAEEIENEVDEHLV
jgi:hypothetical protein